MTLLLAFLLAAAPAPVRDADGRIHRRRAVIQGFMHAHPCPYAPDEGSTERCSNGRVDHRIPLCAGGEDAPENLQWQSVEAAHQKDELEWWVCRRLKEKSV